VGKYPKVCELSPVGHGNVGEEGSNKPPNKWFGP